MKRQVWAISLVLTLILGGKISFAQAIFDPLTIGVGARALGMGKTYVAIAEEGDAIFNNPAGLGEIDYFKFTSMSGILLEDIDYKVIGGIYPLGQQTAVGLGYVGTSLSGIEIRDAAGNFLRKADYGTKVFIASLGRRVSDRTSAGINLKYLLNDGTEIDSGDAYGWNIDLGLLQKNNDWLYLGLVIQNILSSDTVYFQNGESAPFPQIVKVGGRISFLEPFLFSLAIDSEIELRTAKKAIFHIGSEFSPLPLLTFRTGVDDNTYTAGLSLSYAGIKFHYAYRPLAQFFSISFDEHGWPPEGPPDVFWGCKEKNVVLE